MAAETERRRTQGVVGEWEVVNTITPAAYSDDGDEKVDVGSILGTAAAGLKREAEAPDVEDTRSFKLRKKGWGLSLSGGYIPESIPVKLKKKEEVREMLTPTPTITEVASTSVDTTETSTTSTGTSKWTKIQWKRANETTPEVPTSTMQSESTEKEASNKSAMLLSSIPIKDEFDDSALHLSLIEETKADPREPLSSETSETFGMFRKRKIPMRGSRNRRS